MWSLIVRFYLLMVFLGLSLLTGTACEADGSRLAVGDVIGVQVDGEKDFSKSYQLNDSGKIVLPVVGELAISGMNTSEAAAAITDALDNVLVNPQVTVVYIDRGKMQVFVVGHVRKPGLVEIGVGDRLLQALAQAGYDDTSDLSRVTIRRGDEMITLNLANYLAGTDLEANAGLRSGDTIVVQSVVSIGTVLVTGQAVKVGPVPLSRGMTFKELIGLIGGTTVAADTDRITIKREGTSEPVRVEYQRAMDGDPTADIALMPGDVVYIPETETPYYTVMGGVGRPGQYPLKGKMTLSEAIGEAGGPVANVGDMRKVQLIRKPTNTASTGETENINMEDLLKNRPNDQPFVQRGDVIIVQIHKPKPTALQILQSVLPFGWLFR